MFHCLLLGITLPALHALDLTVIWPNAASSSPCLHDVSLTATTVVTLVCLFPKVIQQIDLMLPEYLDYKCESGYLHMEQLHKQVKVIVLLLWLTEGYYSHYLSCGLYVIVLFFPLYNTRCR